MKNRKHFGKFVTQLVGMLAAAALLMSMICGLIFTDLQKYIRDEEYKNSYEYLLEQNSSDPGNSIQGPVLRSEGLKAMPDSLTD